VVDFLGWRQPVVGPPKAIRSILWDILLNPPLPP
jgi:hypothetical protein